MRTGADVWDETPSVVAAQHRLVMAVMAPVVAMIIRAAIDIPARHRALPIGRIGREGTRTGIGRALIDVVVLRSRIDVRAILQLGIRQPLIGPTAAAAVAS